MDFWRRHQHNDANRLLSITHKKNANVLVSLGYGYNTLNDRTSRTETISGIANVDAYDYDPIDQVKEVKYNFNSGANTQDRLVNYVYDPAGNRQTLTDNGAVTNYTANALNQYTAAGSLAPIHDTNGNLTGQGVWTYTYDALNRMTAAQRQGTTVTFAYDPRNRCVKRTINNAVTFLYYDGWSLIEEQNAAGTVLSRYVNGARIDEIIAAVTPNATTYYHQDALGSTVALSTTTGAVAERYSYDVYGAPTIKAPNGQIRNSSSYGNRFFFTGREYIQQALLYDYRNRMYLASFGRFLQRDPIRFDAADYNLYRYVRNSPARFVDSEGLQSDKPPTVVCDGHGHFRIDLNAAKGKADEKCSKEHEQSHLDDFEEEFPSACEERGPGQKPAAPPGTPPEKVSDFTRRTQCKAFETGLKCRQKLLDCCGKDQHARDQIQDGIDRDKSGLHDNGCAGG